MEFPETFDEFVDSYGFVDTEEVYTNGSQLIPVFRVKQWLEHISEKTQMVDKSNFDEEQYKTDLQSAYDCGYNKALSENKGEWIPISERLPEVDQNVLATTRWGALTIAERLNIGPDCWFICEGEANARTKDIVAWQPLPEPYKAESEEL